MPSAFKTSLVQESMHNLPTQFSLESFLHEEDTIHTHLFWTFNSRSKVFCIFVDTQLEEVPGALVVNAMFSKLEAAKPLFEQFSVNQVYSFIHHNLSINLHEQKNSDSARFAVIIFNKNHATLDKIGQGLNFKSQKKLGRWCVTAQVPSQKEEHSIFELSLPLAMVSVVENVV